MSSAGENRYRICDGKILIRKFLNILYEYGDFRGSNASQLQTQAAEFKISGTLQK
jgi:hypothetical protein